MEHIILFAIVPIIVVMLAGYISGKKGIFSGDDAKKFNKVVLDYALPAALFVSIVQATRDMLAKDIKLSLISLIGIMLCFMIVYYVFRMFKKNTGADAAVSALISGSPTIGFLGFAVLEPIFGTTPSVALVVAIVSIVVNAVGIPVGLSLMNASLEKQQPGSTKNRAHGFLCSTHSNSLSPGLLSLQLYGYSSVYPGLSGQVLPSILSKVPTLQWPYSQPVSHSLPSRSTSTGRLSSVPSSRWS